MSTAGSLPKEVRITQRFQVNYDYPVIYTHDVFSEGSACLRDLIPNSANSPVALVVIDSEVAASHPNLASKAQAYFADAGMTAPEPMTVLGGEACKHNDHVVECVYQAVVDHKIDRHSYIVVIGGGAVIDCVGYAAATAHRGIRLIRIPTTVLAQNDAAVGVKNAINYQGRKNFLGSFAPPFAVVNDFDLLGSLPARDKRAGIAEAIKVALIKDAAFFKELFGQRDALAVFEPQAMQAMIVKGAQWHLDHIANHGDPFETGSSRPLDFGHWSAHKLEELSKHALRHGEAVAIGIAIDSIYSNRVGLLSDLELNDILTLLKTLGFTLQHPVLQELDVAQALHEFKEHLGGQLCIMLLQCIGEGVEVNNIDSALMAESVAALATV